MHLSREKRLTWHDGVIPPDQIWIKLGGDKGGKYMKINFQILNVPHPNSIHNTCVFAIFQASDSPTNLHIALDRYQEQVDQLESQTWRYRKYKLVHNNITESYTYPKH